MATKALGEGHHHRLAGSLIADAAKSTIAATQSGRKLGLLGWSVIGPVLALISACSSAVGDDTGGSQAKATSAKAAAATGAEAINAFKIGINVNTLNWWDGSRPLVNLIYGTGWQMQNTNPWGGGEDVPLSSLDANGWVKSVPTGYRVSRGLSVPAAGGDFTCRYQGNGQLTVQGPVSNVSYSAGATRFTIAATYPNPQAVSLYYFVDPSNYIRNIDCRETAAFTTTDLLAPEFVNAMSGFKVIRFMKWQVATENNQPVTWATRNKPGDGDYTRNDGVPVEVLVKAANELNVDPWFTVPWNADDDYITRFATYVRDNMAPGHVAYVETSNEVWNYGYPVATQARSEAIAEGLPSAEDPTRVGANGERYAEKSRQVMAIWSTVFAGQMNRLVRVASFQHVVPYWTNLLLKYQNLSQSVDAVATAPYFGWDLTDGMTADQIFAALPGKVDETINFAVQQKAIAQNYGLRYITYEGGQHLVLPNNVGVLAQVERDTRMADAYKRYISAWQSKIGDTLTLFALTGSPGRYGSWGALEYTGQPIDQAPKMQAIQAFLGTGTTTTTTQTCSDGSVIPSTSTCPTPAPTTQTCPDGSVIPTTSTCPTSGGTTTGGGKKRGGGQSGGKGGKPR